MRKQDECGEPKKEWLAQMGRTATGEPAQTSYSQVFSRLRSLHVYSPCVRPTTRLQQPSRNPLCIERFQAKHARGHESGGPRPDAAALDCLGTSFRFLKAFMPKP